MPVIEKQMLATYYKYSEEEVDDKLIYENRLKEIDKNIAWQKERVKKGEIPYDLYLDFIKDYEEEKKKIVEQLQKGSKGVSNPELCVQFAVNYSIKLKPTWTFASYTDQQRLQFLLFQEGIFYNRAEDKCRTTGVNEAFAYIAELERLLQKCKSRTSRKNFDSAAWVASAGIEPASGASEALILSIVLRGRID